MIRYSVCEGSIVFEVRVIPRSSKSEIIGEHNGALKVKLASPPVEGAANDELIKVIAKAFRVPKSGVEIVSGRSSRTKKVSISGAPSEQINAILQPKS
jgi:uncharacterized protein (TIGR00251 family)